MSLGGLERMLPGRDDEPDTRALKRLSMWAWGVTLIIVVVFLLYAGIQEARHDHMRFLVRRAQFRERCEALGGLVVEKVGGGMRAQRYDDCVFPPGGTSR